jgi:hypothetical protein
LDLIFIKKPIINPLGVLLCSHLRFQVFQALGSGHLCSFPSTICYRFRPLLAMETIKLSQTGPTSLMDGHERVVRLDFLCTLVWKLRVHLTAHAHLGAAFRQRPQRIRPEEDKIEQSSRQSSRGNRGVSPWLHGDMIYDSVCGQPPSSCNAPSLICGIFEQCMSNERLSD